MDNFELFEKVTGRVSLKCGKVLEKLLKETCKKTGAQYHEAADEILISGNWAQVAETRKIFTNLIQGDRSGSTRKESDSSDNSEGTVSRPGKTSFDTIPAIARYIKSYYSHNLKSIEDGYKVKISWSKDYTKVSIKDQSTSHSSFNIACDKFAERYRSFHENIKSITFDVTQDGKDYSKECLKDAVSSLPGSVSGLILEKSADGNVYTYWGTSLALNHAQEWIRQKLGVSDPRPRSISPRGPPKAALTHETPNKLKVVVYQGDITKENADIIVNACNEHLDHAGGLSYAISKAGGPSIQKLSDEYIKKYGLVSTGEIAVTDSGYLHCKYIVHAVGPQWKKHGMEKCMKLFHNVFMNVYKVAQKHGLKSIAMPAISTGIYGVPKDVCAKAAFLFVDEIDQKLASDATARPFEIRLVNIDDKIAKEFMEQFKEWLFKGKKVQRRHSFSGMKKEIKEKPVEKSTLDDMDKTPRLKISLLPFHKSLKKSSGKDVLEMGSSSTTSRINNHGSSSSYSTASKVHARATGISTLTNPSDPSLSSSTSSGFSSLTTATVRNQGAVASTSQPSEKSSSTAVVRYDQNGTGSHSAVDSSNCTICFNAFTNPVALPKCRHMFCKSCIERAFTYQKKCPVCQEVYGVLEGDQPDGTMDVKCYKLHSLPGCEGHGCYVITYVIPSGYQGSRHPKPGHPFTGTKRQAFLPATNEGEVVLKMLKKAFDNRLIFTVGKSNTTGQEDCVIWNDIHHKTSMSGGPQNFGYPDATYLDRVKDELKAKGIVPE